MSACGVREWERGKLKEKRRSEHKHIRTFENTEEKGKLEEKVGSEEEKEKKKIEEK